MESLSNKINEKEEVNSFQTDLEALRNTDKEIYESIQKELQEAEKVWEKARGPLLKLEKKKINSLRSIHPLYVDEKKNSKFQRKGMIFLVFVQYFFREKFFGPVQNKNFSETK